MVIKFLSNVIYRIGSDRNRSKWKVVHFDKLRRYHPRELVDTSWLDTLVDQHHNLAPPDTLDLSVVFDDVPETQNVEGEMNETVSEAETENHDNAGNLPTESIDGNTEADAELGVAVAEPDVAGTDDDIVQDAAEDIMQDVAEDIQLKYIQKALSHLL